MVYLIFEHRSKIKAGSDYVFRTTLWAENITPRIPTQSIFLSFAHWTGTY